MAVRVAWMGLSVPIVFAAMWLVRVSGQRPGGAVEDQAEVGQSAQVERGGSVVKPVVVFGHAAIAHFAVATHQPGDGLLDHRPVSPIFVLPLGVPGISASGALQRVMGTDLQALAGGAGGASGPQRATGAGHAESRVSGAADCAGQSVGTGCGAVGVVDGEVIDGEPGRDSRAGRGGFDQIDMAALE